MTEPFVPVEAPIRVEKLRLEHNRLQVGFNAIQITGILEHVHQHIDNLREGYGNTYKQDYELTLTLRRAYFYELGEVGLLSKASGFEMSMAMEYEDAAITMPKKASPVAWRVEYTAGGKTFRHIVETRPDAALYASVTPLYE